MKITGERYFPRVGNSVFAPYEPFVSYEHWHRYCYALPFVQGKTVLDIASGEGYGSAFLAEHARLVYGVDVSEEAVQHARQAYGRDNLQYLLGSAEAIPIPGEHCFDVVVSFETIEHLDEAGQGQFAAEINRLLRPDGVLLISTPNRATYSNGEASGNPYHFHEFTTDEFLEFLHRSFRHVRLLSQRVYPVSYIWNLEPTGGQVAEYQIRLEDGRFQPSVRDDKETTYLIAVCAHQEEQGAGPDSMLLDLSEVAFRGIPQRERWQTATLTCEAGPDADDGDPAEFREVVEYTPKFNLEYTIEPPREVNQLQWSPLEGRICRVWLRQVVWEDSTGIVSKLDLNLVTSNGRCLPDGTLGFTSLDPMIQLPITGQVARVSIQGECIVGDVPSTMDGLEQSVRSREQELDRQGRELQALRERLAAQDRAARVVQIRLEQEIEERDRQIRKRQGEIDQIQRQVERIQRDLVEVRSRREAAEAELASAFDSLSFRITAPLRTTARAVRRAWRGMRTATSRSRGESDGSPSPPRVHRGHGSDAIPAESGSPGQRMPGSGVRPERAGPPAAPHAAGPLARSETAAGHDQGLGRPAP